MAQKELDKWGATLRSKLVIGALLVAVAAIVLYMLPRGPLAQVRAALPSAATLLFDDDFDAGGSDESLTSHLIVLRARQTDMDTLSFQLIEQGWEKLGDGLVHPPSSLCLTVYTGEEYRQPNLEFIPRQHERARIANAIEAAGDNAWVISVGPC